MLAFNANTILHCKISMNLLYRSNFPKGGISEQFHKGHKEFEDISTGPIRKHQ